MCTVATRASRRAGSPDVTSRPWQTHSWTCSPPTRVSPGSWTGMAVDCESLCGPRSRPTEVRVLHLEQRHPGQHTGNSPVWMGLRAVVIHAKSISAPRHHGVQTTNGRFVANPPYDQPTPRPSGIPTLPEPGPDKGHREQHEDHCPARLRFACRQTRRSEPASLPPAAVVADVRAHRPPPPVPGHRPTLPIGQ